MNTTTGLRRTIGREPRLYANALSPLRSATVGATRERAQSHAPRPQRRAFTPSPPAVSMTEAAAYQDWSRDRLVERVRELEEQLKRQRTEPSQAPPSAAGPSRDGGEARKTEKTRNEKEMKKKEKKKKDKRIDPSKYSTRLVALKLAYLGRRYGGFEYQVGAAVPSVEEELWRALVRSCLIWPDDPDRVDFGPWDYSKCGRTDRGVSAFGQVVAIRLRSNRPVAASVAAAAETGAGTGRDQDGDGDGDGGEGGAGRKPPWDPVADEINYPRVLNRLLPPDIRVLAWAPTLPANFSARFSCWERQYRYFFTQPAFAPLPASLERSSGTQRKEGWLDIGAMRQAAKLFEGVHDFRNFCKVDGAKQITNFRRRVFEADVVEVEHTGSALPFLSRPDFRPADLTGAEEGATYPKVYYFHVRGSAFLWHQIRHMVSILFAVGQGLEKPSIVTELLDVAKHPRKPNYPMADEVPLVLWDCVFPKVDEVMSQRAALDVHDPGVEGNPNLRDGIDWVWLGEDKPSNLHGNTGLVDQLWEQWRERKMDELLANRLLDSVARQADLTRRLAEAGGPPERPSGSQRVFEGGNTAKPAGTYVPVLRKPLLASPEEINDKWAQSKGFASAAALARTKNWRSVIKANKNGSSSAVDSGGDE